MSTHLPASYIEQSRQNQSQLTRLRASRILNTPADVVCGIAIFSADFIAMSCSVAICFFLEDCLASRIGHHLYAFQSGSHQAVALRLVLIFAGVSCYLAEHGHFRDRLGFWNEMRDVVLISTFALCSSLVLSALAGDRLQDFIPAVSSWGLFPLLAMALRQAAKRLLTRLGIWQVPVLVVGDQFSVAEAARLLNLERVPGYKVVGSLHPSLIVDTSFGERCMTALRQLGARRVILCCDLDTDVDYAVMQSVVRARIPFSVLPQSAALPVLGCSITPFFSHDTVMLSYRDNLAQSGPRMIKVGFDLALSAAILAVLLPVFLILAILIRRDGGSVFFGHRRVGMSASMFKCLKFRSMAVNSAELLKDLLARDAAAAAEWANTQKLADDPRVTKVGRLLRATSLDELPQLLNVLRLEMSLIGPRPIVEQEVARYADDIAYYYEVRPGLTGLWQVSGRSDTSYKQRVQLDGWYVRNWSMWHDVAILAKTVPAVLLRHGAR